MGLSIRQTLSIATAAGLVLATAGGAGAQGKKEPSKAAKQLTWGPAPDAFPAGAKMAVEKGNPMKAGEFTVRLSFPANYRIPPHFHPTDEHVRVVSGAFLVGMGEAIDTSKTMKLAPGDTGTVPAKAHHYALTRGATEISLRAVGPFAMTYVNAADDPRKKK